MKPLEEFSRDGWPACQMCRKPAPKSPSVPRSHYDHSAGLAPDLSRWGIWEQPDGSGFRCKYPICDKCSHGVAQFIATRLARFLHKARQLLARRHG